MSEAWVYPAKSDAEIEKLAWAIAGGQVFGSWDCPPDSVHMCFMILAFMEAKHLEDLKRNDIVQVYEYLDKAGPRSVNGYPSFMSVQYINRDDMKKVIARLTEIEAFRKSSGPK